MEPEDLTPVFASESMDLWLKIMRREFASVRYVDNRSFCHATSINLRNSMGDKVFSSCTRSVDHIGPHVNCYGAWV